MNITPDEITRAIRPPKPHPSPAADLTDAQILSLKYQFLDIARSICPQFTIPDELKPTINQIFRWALMLPSPLNPHRGLWLWGDIGTGKSTMLHIIREFCATVRPHSQESGLSFPAHYWYSIVNARKLCADFTERGYPPIADRIAWGRLAIDELGSENPTSIHYGMTENVIQYILQHRYDRRDQNFTHVTTNLTPDQIPAIYGERIYDRAIEMFNFVEFRGFSFRN